MATIPNFFKLLPGTKIRCTPHKSLDLPSWESEVIEIMDFTDPRQAARGKFSFMSYISIPVVHTDHSRPETIAVPFGRFTAPAFPGQTTIHMVAGVYQLGGKNLGIELI